MGEHIYNILRETNTNANRLYKLHTGVDIFIENLDESDSDLSDSSKSDSSIKPSLYTFEELRANLVGVHDSSSSNEEEEATNDDPITEDEEVIESENDNVSTAIEKSTAPAQDDNRSAKKSSKRRRRRRRKRRAAMIEENRKFSDQAESELNKKLSKLRGRQKRKARAALFRKSQKPSDPNPNSDEETFAQREESPKYVLPPLNEDPWLPYCHGFWPPPFVNPNHWRMFSTLTSLLRPDFCFVCLEPTLDFGSRQHHYSQKRHLDNFTKFIETNGKGHGFTMKNIGKIMCLPCGKIFPFEEAAEWHYATDKEHHKMKWNFCEECMVFSRHCHDAESSSNSKPVA